MKNKNRKINNGVKMSLLRIIQTVLCSIVIGLALSYSSLIGEEAAVLRYQQGGAPSPDTFDAFPRREKKASAEPYTYHVSIRHADPEAIKEALLSQYPTAEISLVSGTRSLLITATPLRYKRYLHLIKTLDVAVPLVKIELKIIEINSASLSQYQHVFSKLSQGFRANYDLETGELNPSEPFTLFLQKMSQEGKATILAKPVMMTKNRHEASIQVGDQVPYVTGTWVNQIKVDQVHFLTTGIQLTLRPDIKNNEDIEIELNADISTVKLWKEYGRSQYPVLSTRKTKTSVVIPKGETLVIAGLFEKTGSQILSKVPVLGDIPILGSFFQSNSNEGMTSDVIFMITPYF